MNATGTLMRGLVLGTVAGVMYVASRRTNTEPPRLIQWDRVRKIAERVSKGEGLATMNRSLELTERYQTMVRQSETAIGSYLKQSLPLPLDRIEVFDRPQWIDANIAGFESLFEPLETMNRSAMNGASMGSHLFGEVNQSIISGQLGILLGYLGRRVLGQYDTALLGREPVTTGRLYFVEPNIAMTQQKLGLDAADFRTWIALHETTHAFEFEAHPWLRDYMNQALHSYFDTLSHDFGQFAFGSGGVASLAQRVIQNANRKGNAIEWLMTDEQKAIFERLQALMCLIEGYSNHVMDVVGGQVLATYPLMKARFENRNRQRPLVDQIFTKVTGLDMKLEQYVLGEKFVNSQVLVMGIDRFNKIWDGPELLPTLPEIYEPALWRDRVGTRI